MIQPFIFELFKYGFLLLLISTIIYIIVAHINPPNVPEGESELPVKVSDLEKEQLEPTK
jgi:hypothetical protein